MPAGAVHVKVSVPPFGSTPVAFNVTDEVPSPVTGLGVAVALTEGGVPAGGTAIGTVTVVVDGLVVLAPPTVKENVRLSGDATTGAVNVAVAAVALLMVMIGSPGLTICCHWNGPFVGVLPVEFRATSVPAVIGVAAAVKLATALARFWFAPLQVDAAGAALSGHGFSWPMNCVACGCGTSARFCPSWIS